MNYGQCPFVHSLDELLGGFYTEEVMQAMETYYTIGKRRVLSSYDDARSGGSSSSGSSSNCSRVRLDRKRFIYLKREIDTCYCVSPACEMRGNDYMKNKKIQLYTECNVPTPYCTVTCKKCGTAMQTYLPVYTTLLAEAEADGDCTDVYNNK